MFNSQYLHSARSNAVFEGHELKVYRRVQYRAFIHFASSVNKVETGISQGLREGFQELFQDTPEKVRYKANSIRKFWERLWNVLKNKVSHGITKTHFAQTAHSEKTAMEKYLHQNGAEEERTLVLGIYSERLANRRDAEDSLSEKTSRLDSDLEDEMPQLPVLETSFHKVETVARFNRAGTLCRHPPYGHPRYMSVHPYIKNKRPLQRLCSNCLVRSKRFSCHTLKKYLVPHQNKIHGTHQGIHQRAQRSSSSTLRCPTSESGRVFPNGASIPRRPARCSKMQEGLYRSWK